MHKDLHEENRLSWNEATLAQDSHRGDQIAFFRQGGSTLYPEEKELFGDIHGYSLLDNEHWLNLLNGCCFLINLLLLTHEATQIQLIDKG